jgi:hypothetical protein
VVFLHFKIRAIFTLDEDGSEWGRFLFDGSCLLTVATGNSASIDSRKQPRALS